MTTVRAEFDVRALSELAFRHAPDYGGKAAALGQALCRGFPVFGGVAIGCSEYRDALRRASVEEDARSFWLLDTSDHVTLDAHARAVDEGLDRLDLEGLAADVLARRLEVDPSGGLIVRSSATVEDASARSFAGQFVSERCDASVAGLAEAIRAVWKSCTEPHVVAYRAALARRSGYMTDRAAVQMGVVVQPFSEFDLAGIAFSRHPTVRVRGWMLFEYLDAPPSQLVSGQLVPHRCRVSVDHRVVWEHRCPDHPTLSVEALSVLRKMVEGLRTLFDGEVDVEWGVLAGELRLLQCRRATVTP
jgi:pyruvate,water dikinase